MKFFKERNLPEPVKILLTSLSLNRTNVPNVPVSATDRLMYQRVLSSDEGIWEDALILDEIDSSRCIVKWRGYTVIVDTKLIRPFKKLEYNENGVCKESEQFYNQNWNYLKRFVTLGYSSVLNYDNKLLSFDEEEKIIYYKNDWISVGPGTLEKSSILGISERPCWEISMSVMMRSSSWDEPDDVDIVECGQSENTLAAAQTFIELIWKEENRGYWDNLDLEGSQYDSCSSF